MRRIVLVLIIVAVLGAMAVGGYWYLRRNSGEKRLARAQLALQAQKYDRAADLARSYVTDNPNDWRGYYVQARAHTALGRYEQARRLLDDAAEVAPDRTEIVLLRADTFAHPAREVLWSEDPDLPTDSLRAAIEQLREARDILQNASSPETGPTTELAEALGLMLTDLGAAQTHLAYRLKQEAETADDAGAKDQAEAKRQAADEALALAEEHGKHATGLLLDVVTKAAKAKKPSTVSPRAAEALVRLCIQRDDADALKAARETLMAMDDPPPLAATMLIGNDLGPLGEISATEADHEKMEAASDRLDAILKRHPDHPDILQTRLARARLALRLNDLETAASLCDTILADLPRQRDARLIRALVTMESGKVGEAEKDLFALKTDFPHWPPAHYAYGQAAMRTQKKELAREALRRVTELYPDHAGARALLAQSLLDDGFAEAALTEAQALRGAHPDDPTGLRLLVSSAVAADQPGLALNALKAAEKDYPDHLAMQAAVADGYTHLGKTEQAAEAAERVAASEPQTLRDRLEVAQALLRLGKRAEAEAALLKIVQANPRSPGAHYLLGSVFFDTGRTMQATEHFQAAVDLVPQRTAYRLALARALLRANLIDDAGEQVEAVLARDPSNADAALLANQVHALRGESPDLEGLLETGLTGRTGRALALAYLIRGAPEKAAEVCQNLLQDSPDDVDVRWLLGRAYLAMDDPDACLAQWTAALKAQPDELRFYQHLATVLARDKTVAEIETALAAIPGAREDLTHIASASLLQQRQQHEAAAETYARVADNPDTEEGLRTAARLQKGRCLAEAGHPDLAILEFDRVSHDSPLYVQARLSKAAILAATNRPDEADAVLTELHQAAVTDGKWTTLRRVGALHLRMNQPEQALAVADDAATLAPTNPEPLLLRAAALSRLGRTDETIQCYRNAVALQPGNLALHLHLIEALDGATRRRDALNALAELAEQGQTGRALSLFQRGAMLSRWGLQKQAVAALTELADSEMVTTPQVRLTLGRALAALGQRKKARNQLAAIPPYAPQYVQARQTLAELAETDEAKLAILRQAEKEKPSAAIAAQRINILLRAGRPADAVAAFRRHMDTLTEDAVPSANVATAGLLALLEAGDQAAAANFAARVAHGARDTRWRHLAALLAIQTDPTNARTLLPPPEQAGLYDALLGVCLAARTGGDVSAWADRVDRIHEQATQQQPAGAVPLRYRVLTALASGDAKAAETCLADVGDQELVAPAVMRELVAAAPSDPAAKSEPATLLASTIAADVGLNEPSRQWAMEALRRRPASQWAATLAARGVEDAARLRAIADTLTPDDCVTARFLDMAILRLEGRFAKAADAARALAEDHPDHPELLMSQATATEQSGRLQDALTLYQRVWEKSRNPVAANNAAYLVSVLHPQDPKRLEQALAWAEAAIDAAPTVGAFRDTCGWIAYLLGRNEEACRQLRRAVKGSPGSPEIHYHLGLAERKAGDAQLAEWHLQAAIDLAQAMESEDRELPEGVAEAMRSARSALADLKGSPTP